MVEYNSVLKTSGCWGRERDLDGILQEHVLFSDFEIAPGKLLRDILGCHRTVHFILVVHVSLDRQVQLRDSALQPLHALHLLYPRQLRTQPHTSKASCCLHMCPTDTNKGSRRWSITCTSDIPTIAHATPESRHVLI